MSSAWRSLLWSLEWLLAVGSCERGAATGGAPPSDGGGLEAAEVDREPAVTLDPALEEIWERAAVSVAEGVELADAGAAADDADLARLFDRVGESGLMERAGLPAYRTTVLAALACAEDFTPLPFLADVASVGTDSEAAVALASAASLAALPEGSRDPEDALELREGCDRLVALASRSDAPRARRARAVSVLRMLAGTGCLKREAIPLDLDPK
jgi:hypothetical protein